MISYSVDLLVAYSFLTKKYATLADFRLLYLLSKNLRTRLFLNPLDFLPFAISSDGPSNNLN